MSSNGGAPYGPDEPTSFGLQPPRPAGRRAAPREPVRRAHPGRARASRRRQDPGTGRLIAGRYRLLGKLGHGGMGTVWRAKDETVDREVAVKEPRVPDHLPERERANVFERMRREARAAARLDHPAVVNVHDVAVVDGQPWIVMELVRGRSLGDALQEGTIGAREAARIGLEVLGALEAAHAAGILHRDVKPDNVLLGTARPGRPHRLRHRPDRGRDEPDRHRRLRRLARIHRAGAGVGPAPGSGARTSGPSAWSCTRRRRASRRSAAATRPRRSSPSSTPRRRAHRGHGTARRRHQRPPRQGPGPPPGRRAGARAPGAGRASARARAHPGRHGSAEPAAAGRIRVGRKALDRHRCASSSRRRWRRTWWSRTRSRGRCPTTGDEEGPEGAGRDAGGARPATRRPCPSRRRTRTTLGHSSPT